MNVVSCTTQCILYLYAVFIIWVDVVPQKVPRRPRRSPAFPDVAPAFGLRVSGKQSESHGVMQQFKLCVQSSDICCSMTFIENLDVHRTFRFVAVLSLICCVYFVYVLFKYKLTTHC